MDPATGEWMFNVGDDSVAFFACGWFSYLALAFSAARLFRSQLKPVLIGVVLQTCINGLALAAYVYINGYGYVINTPGSSDSRMRLIRY